MGYLYFFNFYRSDTSPNKPYCRRGHQFPDVSLTPINRKLINLNRRSDALICNVASWCHCDNWSNSDLTTTNPRVRTNLQFCTKCAVLVLICAVLTAHLYSYNSQQSDATPPDPAGELTALPQTSWLDFGERKEREKGGDKNREKGERKGRWRIEMERKRK